ncbi:MAG: glycogen-binding domain-containing protein [Planctomycetota bacterium]|nr:glycogen-binding domain-containing protein [Planctomycetota bacterium]
MTSIRDDGTVEFKFFRPSATVVKLAGDFCAWASGAISMQSQGDGWWIARMKLVSGEYRFRYIADGMWFTDFASHGIEVTKVAWNSVLLVPSAVQEYLEPGEKFKAKFAA